MTATPDIVYLVYREGLNSVFLSQMATPTGLLKKRGCPTRLWAFASIGEFVRPLHRGLWSALRAATDAPIARLPSPPSRWRNAWDESRVLAWALRRRFSRERRVILDCAGTFAAVIALAVRETCPNVRIIHRMFGLTHEELLYEAGVIRPEQLPAAEKERYDSILDQFDRATRQPDAVVCVSDAMVRYATTHFSADPARFSVVPCCVDTDRFRPDPSERARTRRELSIDDRFVVVYSGSFHRWQAPQKGAEIFRHLQAVEPRAHFLVLTTNPDKFRACVRDAGIPESAVTVLSAPHNEVPRYLAAGDVGILPREPSIVNATASPVKFAEYLAAGLPVVISDGVGDYSDAVQRADLGIVLRSDAEPDFARRQLARFVGALGAESAAVRARCIAHAEQTLSWHACLPKLARVYESFA